MINELKPNQIFVFGSNLAGKHYGGAAKQAYEQFGAVMGIGKGVMGQTYAFPTLDKEFKQLSRNKIRRQVHFLFVFCDENPDKEFLLTKVGCGIAGIDESFMRSMFKNPRKNMVLPEDWR